MQKLHRLESDILGVLRDKHRLSISNISNSLRIKPEAAYSGAKMLEERGYVEIEEEKGIEYELTPTGKEALRYGLPELKVLKCVDENPSLPIDKLPIPKETLSIGIGQAIKSSLLVIEEGNKPKLTSKGEDSLRKGLPEEGALHNLRDADAKTIQKLIKRGLVEQRERSGEIWVRITKEGQRTPVVTGISELTSDMIKSGSWKDAMLKPYDIRAPAPVTYIAKFQPYRKFLDDVKRKLLAMGFVETRGPLVDLAFWNFDALFQAQNHPAREVHDSYMISEPGFGKVPKKYVEKVKEVHESSWRYKWNEGEAAKLVARSQGTTLSARALADIKVPAKIFAIARVFRPDTLDRTHLFEFNQIEGIVVDEGLNMRHLLGLLKTFAREIAGISNIKYLPSYYPFTEPSVDMMARTETGWVELGGSGIFRPEVTEPFGIDEPVLAWGLGLDRLAMFKLNIEDIRYLFSYDLDWLRKTPPP